MILKNRKEWIFGKEEYLQYPFKYCATFQISLQTLFQVQMSNLVAMQSPTMPRQLAIACHQLLLIFLVIVHVTSTSLDSLPTLSPSSIYWAQESSALSPWSSLLLFEMRKSYHWYDISHFKFHCHHHIHHHCLNHHHHFYHHHHYCNFKMRSSCLSPRLQAGPSGLPWSYRLGVRKSMIKMIILIVVMATKIIIIVIMINHDANHSWS